MSTRKSTRRTTTKRTTSKQRTRRRPNATASRKSIKRTKPRTHSTKRSRKTRTAAPTAWITGTFDGQILSNSQLHFSRTATCTANVKAPSVQIDGTVRGTVIAQNTMKLGSRAIVQGTIVAEKLFAADGAQFNGQCQLGRWRKAA